VPAVPDECRFTTEEMLATERQVIEGCLKRNARRRIAPDEREVTLELGDGSYVVERRPKPIPEAVIEAAVGVRPSLSGEQREMVRRLTMGRDAVMMVRGHAGTGKTSALDACRQIWKRSGRTVIGCALSGRAAAELQAGAGIQSTTIDCLLLDFVQYRQGILPRGDAVLVVDEAGMVGTRLLGRLLAAAEKSDTTIVLVGDDRQLPEIDAGGAYRGLCDRLGAVELVENRRQRDEWERQALSLLREGRSYEALAAYVEHGRIVLGSSGDCVRARLVADWWAAERSGGDNVMVALRRADVRELNERARALRVAAGDVAGPALALSTGEFAVGDRVVTTRNQRSLGVVNGSRGIVMAVDEYQRTLTLHLDGQWDQATRVTVLPAEYLEAGHLAHGYAITGHKSQGMTADCAFVLGDEAMYREWGYVALSRGRADNRLYVVAGERDPTDDSGHGRIPTSRSESLTLRMIESVLMKSSEKRLALVQFQKVAGQLPVAEPAPPSTPPQDLDDVGLRAEAALAREALVHSEPFPSLAEPNLVDPGRTVVQLSEQHRYLAHRRARLEAEMESTRTRLATTEGVIGRRRHRELRGWLQGDLSRGARDIADIDRQLPELETRIGAIRSDQVGVDGWYQRQAEAGWRWCRLYDEACARIDRRVQAAAAAPSVAGHAAPPASFSAEWDWWSSAVEVERRRLWEGEQGSARQAPARPNRQAATSLAVQPNVADIVGRVEAAEAAVEGRRERQRQRAGRPASDPSYGHSVTHQYGQQRVAEQEQSIRWPRMAP
jgi:AAA domain/UvrD-like helicase C-terminal domain